MTIVLRQGDTKKNMQKLLDKLIKNRKARRVDVHKYCGTINLKDDALTIQKKMRSEWD